MDRKGEKKKRNSITENHWLWENSTNSVHSCMVDSTMLKLMVVDSKKSAKGEIFKRNFHLYTSTRVDG